MTKLSVNINKIATLRNTRHLDVPSLTLFARVACDAGADGITIHPRPDERHVRSGDVGAIAGVLRDYPGVEFNIEGNPFHGLLEHARQHRPTQVTLVPDAIDSFTSNAGWDLRADGDRLKPVIAELKSLGCRVSLFIDAAKEGGEPAIDGAVADGARADGADGAEAVGQGAVASGAAPGSSRPDRSTVEHPSAGHGGPKSAPRGAPAAGRGSGQNVPVTAQVADLNGAKAGVSTGLSTVQRAAALGADRVELYTEPYAAAFAAGDARPAEAFAMTARAARAAGLGVNAGHDLNLQNLRPFLKQVPGVLEVSIGHALIADALAIGFAEAVRRYRGCCGMGV